MARGRSDRSFEEASSRAFASRSVGALRSWGIPVSRRFRSAIVHLTSVATLRDSGDIQPVENSLLITRRRVPCQEHAVRWRWPWWHVASLSPATAMPHSCASGSRRPVTSHTPPTSAAPTACAIAPWGSRTSTSARPGARLVPARVPAPDRVRDAVPDRRHRRRLAAAPILVLAAGTQRRRPEAAAQGAQGHARRFRAGQPQRVRAATSATNSAASRSRRNGCTSPPMASASGSRMAHSGVDVDDAGQHRAERRWRLGKARCRDSGEGQGKADVSLHRSSIRRRDEWTVTTLRSGGDIALQRTGRGASPQVEGECLSRCFHHGDV